MESAPGKGSCFEVYLPQVSETSQVVAAVEGIAFSPAPGTPTIMVVEDDGAVRELASKFLDTAGYRVLVAKDGVEALQIAKEYGQSTDALLTDVVMPRMRGTELAARFSNLLSEVKVVYMSGYLEHSGETHKFLEDGVFLEKPFTRESLLSKVNEAFRSPGLANLQR